MQYETVILAGGCFWGMQDLFRKQTGVYDTEVGYTGDPNHPNATYRSHGQHAEAIRFQFDTSATSYENILAYFFQIHNPCTPNQQGNDIGPSYRSVIYYLNDEQKNTAEAFIAKANASGIWPGPIVTSVEPASEFWLAEPEHQDYLQNYPSGYTCHFPRPDWVMP